MESDTLLAISLIGFGVQQFLQVVADPLAAVAISAIRARQPPAPGGGPSPLPGGLSDTDAKKALLGLASFFLGLVIVRSAGDDLLLFRAIALDPLPPLWLDVFVSALTIAAGTEGANSVLKLLQYAKDALKARTSDAGAQDSPVRRTAPGTGGRAPASNDSPEPDRDDTPNLGDDSGAAEEGEHDEALPEPEPEPEPHASISVAAAAAAVRWRAAESLLKLRAQVNQLAPNRSKRADGLIGDAAHARRNSDHNPWVRDGGMGVVTAIDITHDPARGCDAGRIAEALRASQDPRIKYIIWNRRIASAAPRHGRPAWAWRPYTGANPHTSHVHISVQPRKALYDSATPWNL